MPNRPGVVIAKIRLEWTMWVDVALKMRENHYSSDNFDHIDESARPGRPDVLIGPGPMV